MILAGGPHKGFNKKILKLKYLALLFGVRPFFEMAPGSVFLDSMGSLPDAIYIGGERDNVVPKYSAAPNGVRRRIIIRGDHHMFPDDPDKVASSAIPIAAEVVRRFLEKQMQIA